MDKYLSKTEVEQLFRENKDIGKAEGSRRGKLNGTAEALLIVLRARFQSIPENIERTIRQMANLSELQLLVPRVATCQSLDEFAVTLNNYA